MSSTQTVAEVGMPCSTRKADSSEAKRNETRVTKLMREDPSNLKCADCSSTLVPKDAWAAINLGCFFCIKCAGIHRQLGVHISKVRMVHGDDWNDDWVDNMAKWGNERAERFWEARAPPQRPTPDDSAGQQTKLLVDFIKAKYNYRKFAAEGEPTDWLENLTLANGWARFRDEASNAFYYHNAGTGETAWEMPAAAQLEQQAAAAPSRPGREGVLEKKSGGKDGKEKMKLLQKWDKRFFALAPGATQLKYYKSADAMKKGEEPLGVQECTGATVFLKEVTKKAEYRFTVKTSERELKLRAGTKEEYDAWQAALKPVVDAFGLLSTEDDD